MSEDLVVRKVNRCIAVVILKVGGFESMKAYEIISHSTVPVLCQIRLTVIHSVDRFFTSV